MSRLAITVAITALCACGGSSGGSSNHDDDPSGDDDCVVDVCGVCDGDGGSCVPESAINWVLQVEGASLGVFPLVRGVGGANALVETAGGVVPGTALYQDITLTRLASYDLSLTSWRTSIEEGEPATKDATLTLVDDELGVIGRWSLSNAWPSALEVTPAAQGLRETVVLTHTGCRRAFP